MIPINGNITRKIIEWTAIILIALFSFFATFKSTVNNVKEMRPMVFANDKSIDIIKNDLGYIKAGIRRIERKLK